MSNNRVLRRERENYVDFLDIPLQENEHYYLRSKETSKTYQHYIGDKFGRAVLVTSEDSEAMDLTPFYLVSLNSTNPTVIKASRGRIYGWYIFNNHTDARKVMFHDLNTTPTAGVDTFFPLTIPGGAGANVLGGGSRVRFDKGIAMTTVTGIADTDATPVGAGDLVITIFYL